MYIGPGTVGAPTGLRLSHAEHWTFDGGMPFTDYDRGYLSDLWRLYGLAWDDRYLAGRRNCFTPMLQTALEQVRSKTGPPDVVVLANATPDAEPGYPMPYAQSLFDEVGTAFAVSDQGAAAAFTALRLVCGGMAAGEHGRALVAIVDQRSVLGGTHVPDALRPTRDSTVILALSREGAFGAPEVRQHVRVPDDAIAALLRAEVGGEETTVICRPELVPHWRAAGAPVEILEIPPGLPGTGPWSTLARHCAAWDEAAPRRVVVADLDPALGYLSTCRFDPAVTA